MNEEKQNNDEPGCHDNETFVQSNDQEFTISATLNNKENTMSIKAMDNASYQEYTNTFNADDKSLNSRKLTHVFNMFKSSALHYPQKEITTTAFTNENDDELIIRLHLNTEFDDALFEFKLNHITQDFASVFKLIKVLQNKNERLRQRVEKLEIAENENKILKQRLEGLEEQMEKLKIKVSCIDHKKYSLILKRGRSYTK